LIINVCFYDGFSTPLSTSLLIRLCVYPTQASLLGILITFVNNFHSNLVEMSVCSVK